VEKNYNVIYLLTKNQPDPVYHLRENLKTSATKVLQRKCTAKLDKFLEFDLVELQRGKNDPKLSWMIKFEYFSIKSHDFLFS
jgi:hypothetical protein